MVRKLEFMEVYGQLAENNVILEEVFIWEQIHISH